MPYDFIKNSLIILKEIDRRIGAKIFYLPHGLIEEILASIRLSLNSLSAKKLYLDKYEKDYKKGFKKLSSIIDEDFLIEMKNTLNSAIKEKNTDLSIIKEDNIVLSQALSFKHGDKVFEKFKSSFSKTESSNLLHGVLKGEYKLLELILWRNYHLPEHLRVNRPDYYSATLHTDGCPVDFAKLFINLQDVELNHGPTFILSKKLSKDIIKIGYKDRSNYNKAKNKINQLETNPENLMTGKAGDGFYFNPACCLHRASIPEKGSFRDMLMIIAEPSLKAITLVKPKI